MDLFTRCLITIFGGILMIQLNIVECSTAFSRCHFDIEHILILVLICYSPMEAILLHLSSCCCMDSLDSRWFMSFVSCPNALAMHSVIFPMPLTRTTGICIRLNCSACYHWLCYQYKNQWSFDALDVCNAVVGHSKMWVSTHPKEKKTRKKNSFHINLCKMPSNCLGIQDGAVVLFGIQNP